MRAHIAWVTCEETAEVVRSLTFNWRTARLRCEFIPATEACQRMSLSIGSRLRRTSPSDGADTAHFKFRKLDTIVPDNLVGLVRLYAG